ncbi:hypothetical protein MKX03_015086 [Papaver bracteatum]|nr:hypothetical protein MKX03_015086 [Papaver bracteatum]
MDIIHDITQRGDVNSLEILLAANPGFPLADPKFTCFLRTPLHVAVMRDYVDFAEVILDTNPLLANEKDSQGLTPLHLATARNNVDMVKLLLNANTDACIVPDKDGRTPLHIAARRNEVSEVMELLIQSRPEAIHQKLRNTNETILHLCVKHDNFMAMKKLVNYLVSNSANIANNPDSITVNSVDCDGNTILHLAAQRKRMKMLKYLLDSSEIGVDVNIQNTTPEQLSALEMLDKIELYALGIDSLDIHITREVPQQRTRSSNNKWLKERLNTLMIVATLIAAIAFQAVLNPPGGVFQDDSKIDSIKDPVMFTRYLQNVMGTRMSQGFESYIDNLPPQNGTAGNITDDEIIIYRANFVKNLLHAAKTSESYTSSMSPYMSQKLAPGIVLEEDRWMSIISSYNTTYGGASSFSPYLIRYAGTAILAYRSPRSYEAYMLFNSLSLAVCGLTIFLVTIDAISQRQSGGTTAGIVYLEVLMSMAVVCIGLSYWIIFGIISPPSYQNNSLAITIIVAIIGITLLGPIATSIYTLVIFIFHYSYTKRRYRFRLQQYAHSHSFSRNFIPFCIRSYHRIGNRFILICVKLSLFLGIFISFALFLIL